MRFFDRLFGKKPQPAFSGPGAQEVLEETMRNAQAFLTGSGLSEVGILFEVDDLGGDYGRAAYRIVLDALDPRELRGCFVCDGDAMAMRGNLYCICFQTTDSAKAEYVRRTMAGVLAKGLLPGDRRFAASPVAGPNSLVVAGQIDSAGRFIVARNGMVRAEWADGTAWSIYAEL